MEGTAHGGDGTWRRQHAEACCQELELPEMKEAAAALSPN